MHHDEFAAIAVGLMSSLYKAAFRLTRDERDAEDLVQDMYAYAFENASELRSPAAAKTWLLRILYHRFISLRRTARARPELKVLEGGLEESSAAIEVALRLERATLGRLSPRHHQGHRAVARGASHRRGH